MGFCPFAEPARISQRHAVARAALPERLEELPAGQQVVQRPVDSPARLKVAQALDLPGPQPVVPSMYRLHRVMCPHLLFRTDGIGRSNRSEVCRDSRVQGLQPARSQPRYRLAFSLALSPPRIL